MGFKIKNTSKRRIGIVTSAGIQTLAPGKSGTYSDCQNAALLENVAKVTPTKDEDLDAAQAAAAKTAPNQPAASEGNKPRTPPVAPPATA